MLKTGLYKMMERKTKVTPRLFLWNKIIDWYEKNERATQWPIKEDWRDMWENERPMATVNDIKRTVEELIDMKNRDGRKRTGK